MTTYYLKTKDDDEKVLSLLKEIKWYLKKEYGLDSNIVKRDYL